MLILDKKLNPSVTEWMKRFVSGSRESLLSHESSNVNLHFVQDLHRIYR